ncbi:MAG: hypothetical protein HQL53_10755 [Magnetococcales bacterium]|nr:hypothetical protein [Magnetococcales bacterium]
MERSYNNGGIEAVRSDLSFEAANARNLYPNSWQSATFEAPAASDWYCRKGFRMG